MSYYTIRVTNALAEVFSVAFIPMRRLIPTFLYPGRSRVGSTSTRFTYVASVFLMTGVDWYWGRKFPAVLFRIRTWRPEVVIFEWWTGTVLHTYLAIAIVAKLSGASIIVEFHEVLDSGEERIPLARAWVALLGRPFFHLASAFVIHSENDRSPIERRYRLRGRPCVVIPHGPLDHHAAPIVTNGGSAIVPLRAAPDEVCNLLFFGIIRPYKGLEDLVRAFDALDEQEVERFWLTVVGETWEGWDLPIDLIEESRYRERITLVNRFVHDDEVIAYFAGADAVVLPYHRSSASSPAHVTMSNGLPLIITSVGGLPAAVADYDGALLVPPHDPAALANAIRLIPEMGGQRFKDPHSWDRTVALYEGLMRDVELRRRQGHLH
jgi:glycosyltransferase involved in cell wall biosynthesis